MYLTKRFFLLLAAATLLTGLGYAFAPLFAWGKVLSALLLAATVVDVGLLYTWRGLSAERRCDERFSNGDPNRVEISLESRYPFGVGVTVVDEAPAVFQRRDIAYKVRIPAGASRSVAYTLTPTRRGVYDFGRLRCFARTAVGLAERRYTLGRPQEVKVYPSYLMLNRYELLAMSHQLTEMGIKRIRRVGHHTEFEQIKDYVQGDEFRAINWKASARRHQLMVNAYRDERSQQVISVIDKGRVMQQSFHGMTLLDHSINAALVISYVAMRREDKAGLITFADRPDSFVAPSSRSGQMQRLLEALYAQRTTFGETDFSSLCVSVRKQLDRRSLLILYTNFPGMGALRRQLPYLRLLSRRHRLLVVYFEDSETDDYIRSPKTSTEDYYQHVIAEKFVREQRLIASTLRQNGILSLLTTPERLSVDVINKYLSCVADRGIG
ncbi:DUF58 domain-containing protein [Prevotella sp. A2931]|uniref:DUF58 domain-containing protein n=1 Tax=Prevotella illustrans TaxID=2800387 RepID=A0ABS3M5J5_9BACT|nr:MULTISPECIES: DUF58 domain-containing protein [Prevotella]MBO1363442.1 DUF58 domain-containing protein [Prevotella illustrans]PTL26345.1 DUF58 domain-containing protein [Prevotella sp. oral taxon 820]